MTLMSIAKKIVPTITTAAAVLFVQPSPGWATVYDSIKNKDWKGTAQNFIAGMTGIRLNLVGDGSVMETDIMDIINPLELSSAPVPKIALWSSLTVETIAKVGTFIRGIFNELT